MASTYLLLRQPGAALTQGKNMASLDPGRDIVVDPLLGASYSDPLSSAFTAQSAAVNAPAHLAASSHQGPWNQFNFQFHLRNDAVPEPLERTHLNIQPATTAFASEKISNLPKSAGQPLAHKGNDENDSIRQNLEWTRNSSPPISSSRAFLSSNRRPHTRSESTASSLPEPAPPSTQKPARKPRTRKRGAAAVSVADREDEDDSRRDRFLERNRQAASKCRKKKKEWVHELQESRVELEAKNNNLHTQFEELLSEVTEMKNSLLTHASCNDPVINGWIENEARKYVETSLKLHQAQGGDAEAGTEKDQDQGV